MIQILLFAALSSMIGITCHGAQATAPTQATNLQPFSVYSLPVLQKLAENKALQAKLDAQITSEVTTYWNRVLQNALQYHNSQVAAHNNGSPSTKEVSIFMGKLVLVCLHATATQYQPNQPQQWTQDNWNWFYAVQYNIFLEHLNTLAAHHNCPEQEVADAFIRLGAFPASISLQITAKQILPIGNTANPKLIVTKDAQSRAQGISQPLPRPATAARPSVPPTPHSSTPATPGLPAPQSPPQITPRPVSPPRSNTSSISGTPAPRPAAQSTTQISNGLTILTEAGSTPTPQRTTPITTPTPTVTTPPPTPAPRSSSVTNSSPAPSSTGASAATSPSTPTPVTPAPSISSPTAPTSSTSASTVPNPSTTGTGSSTSPTGGTGTAATATTTSASNMPSASLIALIAAAPIFMYSAQSAHKNLCNKIRAVNTKKGITMSQEEVRTKAWSQLAQPRSLTQFPLLALSLVGLLFGAIGSAVNYSQA